MRSAGLETSGITDPLEIATACTHGVRAKFPRPSVRALVMAAPISASRSEAVESHGRGCRCAGLAPFGVYLLARTQNAPCI